MSIDPKAPINTLALERLLEPISADVPTGPALDFDSFSGKAPEVREYRDSAAAAERVYRDWQIGVSRTNDLEEANREPPRPAWLPVVEGAIDLLDKSSKDLRVAAWLGEGLVRIYGLDGLLEALRLYYGLCEKYWESLHPPLADEDGLEAAVAGLWKLFSLPTIRAMEDTVFVESKPTGPAAQVEKIRFHQYKYLSDFDRIPEKDATRKLRQDRLNWIPTAVFEKVAAQADVTKLREMHSQLKESTELCIKLQNLFDERCREDVKAQDVREALSDMTKATEKLLQRFGGITESPSGGETFEPADSAMIVAATPTQQGAFMFNAANPAAREEAFRVIEQIADYFEKQEPHSPVHYALRQSVRWGRMNFPDLLRELLDNDDKIIDALRKRVGLTKDDQ